MARTKHRGARARPPLTRERVLRAALSLADRGGIDSLSMRKLASKLRVEAMSLYNHVRNKDDILDGIADIVVSEIEVPTVGGDWKQAMRGRARSAHAVLLRHPWATMVLVCRPNVGPSMLRYVDATLGCLRAAGFSYALADHAWNAIDSHIYGFTLQVLNFPFEPEEYASVAEEHLARVPEDRYPYLYGLAQEVIEGRHDGTHTLEFGLELILEGLEAKLRASCSA